MITRVGWWVAYGICLSGIIWTISWGAHMTHAQTTIEEREALRTMALELDQVTAVYNNKSKEFYDKLQATPEAKAKVDLETRINVEVKRLQDKCSKSGKELSMDLKRPADYLRCIEKNSGGKK